MNLDLSKLEKIILKVIGDDIKYPPRSDLGYNSNSNKYEGYSYKDPDTVYANLMVTVSKREFEKVLEVLFFKGLISFTRQRSQYLHNCWDIRKIEPPVIQTYKEEVSSCDNIIRLTSKEERVISGQEVYQYILRDELATKQDKLREKLRSMETSLKEVSHNSTYPKIIGIITIFITVLSLILGNLGAFHIISVTTYQEALFVGLTTNGAILTILVSLLFSLKYLIFRNKDGSVKDYYLFLLPIMLFLTALYIILYL